MSLFKLSTLHCFTSLSLRLKKVTALQFLRHPPVQSVSFWVFSHLLSYGCFYPPLENGSTRLTILSMPKERGSPRGVGNPTPQGEWKFSDQTAQPIRLASRHKRYLLE